MSDENNCSPVPFLHFPGGMLCLTEESDDKLLWCEVNNPDQRHYFDRYKPMHLAQQIEWRQSLGKRADTNQAFKIVVEEKKTSFHIKNKSAFAGVHPRKNYFILNIVSALPIKSSRMAKIEQVSKSRFHNELRIEKVGDMNNELINWLKEAYVLMG